MNAAGGGAGPRGAFVQYATAKIGAILVNINPAYRTHELEYVLNQSGVALLVAARSFKTSDFAGMIEEIRPRCPGLQQVVLLGSPEWDALATGSGGDEDDLWDELARVQASLSPDDPINIQYTSGTRGFPKGATLSHHNIVNNGFSVGSLCDCTEADRVCIPVPFYHCFGMVMGNLGCTTHGATMVIPAPAFDPAATLRAVAQERCTSLYGVPTMFIAELAVPDVDSYDLSSLRTGIMAGSPCPVEVMKQVVDRMGMTQVTICYGISVMLGYWNNISPREVEEFLHTHPDVRDVQVVGVPDPRYGEELCAWVILRAGVPTLTAEAVREFAGGRRASYKIPRYVLVVDEFPMTVTGKVRKVEMRERSVQMLDLGEAAAVRTA